jgi:cell division FtsZ-interacting protein ZapD
MEDSEILKRNAKLLSLTEHPVWGVFVSLVEEDMNKLDSITSLMLSDKSRDELVREVEVRYHTIEAIRQYIGIAIERSQAAIQEIEESKSDLITVIEP